MKIAIMGTGGVGGYYGGLLAKQGHEVTFIARGAHLQAIQKNGLQIKSIHGDFIVSPAAAVADPTEVDPVDLVLVCVKTYDTESVARTMTPLVGAQTTVLSLQNGIDAAERIGEVVGMEHVLGGITQISSAIESPGVIKQVSQFRRVVFGELDGSISARTQSIEKALKETGITAEITQDIHKALWAKLVFISAASGLGALTRLPMGEYRAVPEARAIIISLMKEVEAVARAQGVALDADVVQKSLAFMDNAAPHIKASMQLDVETSHRTEIEAMIGVIGRKGRELGVPTPTADFIYAALLPIDLKARHAG
ncbi:MAG TPA: 2-dehydropantoate 2-reductase [Anaerolineales bacterium]|nr:2-dehydropantoate 2-reductase [Anaerolineales bacterium]